MAKDKDPIPMPTRQNVHDAERRPPLPMATARELARVELQRWQQVVDVLALAATYEDEAGTIERKLAALRDKRAQAEADHVEALETLATEREGQQILTDAVVAVTRQEIDAIYAEKTAACATMDRDIAAKQAELIEIGRDQDAARQARAEHAGLLAEVQALRTERDELVAKLTR